MKTRLITALTMLLFCNGYLFSQDKDTIVQLPIVTVTSSIRVNETLTKAFNKSFPKAENLRWYKYDKNYLAKFIKDDMDHNAMFEKNGYLNYVIGFGYEKHLPTEILGIVQNAYSDFKITRVFNIKTGGRNIWVVNLEGMKNYIMVRVEDQELDEVGRFKKSE